MERISLTAEKREPGKGLSRRLRTDGMVPGVIYGRKIEPVPVKVNADELERATKTKAGMNVLVDLKVEGMDSGLAFIRDYQADQFRRRLTHVDFQAISIDEPIDVEVPIDLVGECKGVKEGGVVDQSRRALHVRSLPDRIPERITVDISGLDIGDSVHADELALPEGVEFPHTVNYTIVSIVPPAKEEVAAVVAPIEGEAVAAEGAAPAEAGEAEGKPEGKAEGKPEGKADKKEEKA